MRILMTLLAATAWISVAPVSAQVRDLREMNTSKGLQ
jgi:hypothetical protein